MYSSFDPYFNNNSIFERFADEEVIYENKDLTSSPTDITNASKTQAPTTEAPVEYSSDDASENKDENCKNLISTGEYTGQYTCPRAYMGAGGHCVCGPGCVEFTAQAGMPPICCSSVIDIRGDKFCVDNIPSKPQIEGTLSPSSALGGDGSSLNPIKTRPDSENRDSTCKNLIASGHYTGEYTCPDATMGGKGHCNCGSGCVEFIKSEGSPPVCCTSIIDIRGDKFCVDDAPVGKKSYWKDTTEAPLGLSGYDPTDPTGADMKSMLEKFGNTYIIKKCGSGGILAIFIITLFILFILFR